MQETTISRNWLAKMSLFVAAFFGLGVWGLVDALVVYPNRGAKFAEFAEFRYLETLESNGEILRASIDEPQQRLDILKSRRAELTGELSALPADSAGRARVQAQLNELDWLEALDIIGRATPAHTTFDSPSERIDELRDDWATAEQPKQLSGLDIPTQWLFVVIGGLGGAWMLLTVMRVVKTKYRYEAESHTLKLPSGESFTPDQIVEMDKRKWDKFFVTIKLQDGAAHKLDLLRYQPLEEWVLEMEKLSPNYEPPEEDDKDAPGEGDSPPETEDDAPRSE